MTLIDPDCSCVYYIIVWKYGFVDISYISVMMLLTFDRFLTVYLNIKYHLYQENVDDLDYITTDSYNDICRGHNLCSYMGLES